MNYAEMMQRMRNPQAWETRPEAMESLRQQQMEDAELLRKQNEVQVIGMNATPSSSGNTYGQKIQQENRSFVTSGAMSTIRFAMPSKK